MEEHSEPEPVRQNDQSTASVLIILHRHNDYNLLLYSMNNHNDLRFIRIYVLSSNPAPNVILTGSKAIKDKYMTVAKLIIICPREMP